MRKNLISILAAGFLFSVPTYADHENRFHVDSLHPGVAIEMNDAGMIDGTIVNIEDGMVWLETGNKLSLVVPQSQSMWIGERMATSSDLTIGTPVCVEFPRDQELRVMEVNGDQVLLGSYNGIIYIPASIVSNDFDADFYTYDPAFDTDDE